MKFFGTRWSDMTNAKILVIDDEAGIRDLLTRELSSEGYWTASAVNGLEAMEKIGQEKYQIALCDLNMPKLGGLKVLEEIRKLDQEIEVIIMTGYASIDTAVEAMKQGAYDFVQKPFNLIEVLALVEKCLEKSELKSVVQQLRIAKKTLEETQMQLIQSEKLAGIGQLAAGVAHELNNPLSGVMGFAQLMLDDRTLSVQQKNDVQTIYTQSQRCKTIIQNLLQFCRRKEAAQEVLDLVPLLQTTVNLVQYDFSTSGIELTQNLPPSLPLVLGDANQLQQVFLNLITNARQAMEKQIKGRLIIDSQCEGSKLSVRLSDNGPGIPADILGKIFDPFFTTKAPGKGTGLGLSISYGIVKNHHGDLRVESRLAEGSTFIIELPIQP